LDLKRQISYSLVSNTLLRWRVESADDGKRPKSFISSIKKIFLEKATGLTVSALVQVQGQLDRKLYHILNEVD